MIDANGYILQDTPKWKKRFIDKTRQLYLRHKEQIDEWYNKYSHLLTFIKVYRKFEFNCGKDYENFHN